MSTGLFQKTRSLCFSSQSNKTISAAMNGIGAYLVPFSLQNTSKEMVIFFFLQAFEAVKRDEARSFFFYTKSQKPREMVPLHEGSEQSQLASVQRPSDHCHVSIKSCLLGSTEIPETHSSEPPPSLPSCNGHRILFF